MTSHPTQNHIAIKKGFWYLSRYRWKSKLFKNFPLSNDVLGRIKSDLVNSDKLDSSIIFAAQISL
jgi:hypothetical protein